MRALRRTTTSTDSGSPGPASLQPGDRPEPDHRRTQHGCEVGAARSERTDGVAGSSCSRRTRSRWSSLRSASPATSRNYRMRHRKPPGSLVSSGGRRAGSRAAGSPRTRLPPGFRSATPGGGGCDVRGYDAVDTAARLALPMLLLQGGRDYQVTVDGDLALWSERLAARADAAHPRSRRDSDHLFFPGIGPSTRVIRLRAPTTRRPPSDRRGRRLGRRALRPQPQQLPPALHPHSFRPTRTLYVVRSHRIGARATVIPLAASSATPAAAGASADAPKPARLTADAAPPAPRGAPPTHPPPAPRARACRG